MRGRRPLRGHPVLQLRRAEPSRHARGDATLRQGSDAAFRRKERSRRRRESVMNAGSSRPLAQEHSDPKLVGLSEAARRHALRPGWEFQGGRAPAPVPAEQAYRWSWSEVLRPMMVKAYDVVDPVKAERRNLIMANPGLKRAATTETLIAAIQGVLPGEIAPAHRHTAGALRLMIEGHGSLTNVDGEPCVMDPASLILTPQRCWHDHANETGEPVIWLDVLDVPFVLGIN